MAVTFLLMFAYIPTVVFHTNLRLNINRVAINTDEEEIVPSALDQKFLSEDALEADTPFTDKYN